MNEHKIMHMFHFSFLSFFLKNFNGVERIDCVNVILIRLGVGLVYFEIVKPKRPF